MLVRVEQTTEDPMTASTPFTEIVGGETPPVRLEPCAAFRPDHDATCPACEVCGWLEHDHAGPDALAGAVVTVLRFRAAPLPELLAS
jgi:hypothetical protein